jgi:hypothetical protein
MRLRSVGTLLALKQKLKSMQTALAVVNMEKGAADAQNMEATFTLW